MTSSVLPFSKSLKPLETTVAWSPKGKNHKNSTKITNEVAKKKGSISALQSPCRFFQLGQCSKGSRCQFAHKKKEPQLSNSIACKFYVQGFCRNGDSCQFSHSHFKRKNQIYVQKVEEVESIDGSATDHSKIPFNAQKSSEKIAILKSKSSSYIDSDPNSPGYFLSSPSPLSHPTFFDRDLVLSKNGKSLIGSNLSVPNFLNGVSNDDHSLFETSPILSVGVYGPRSMDDFIDRSLGSFSTGSALHKVIFPVPNHHNNYNDAFSNDLNCNALFNFNFLSFKNHSPDHLSVSSLTEDRPIDLQDELLFNIDLSFTNEVDEPPPPNSNPTFSYSFENPTDQLNDYDLSPVSPTLSPYPIQPSDDLNPEMTSSQLCTFHIEGNCRYGENCRNIHGILCDICVKPALMPGDHVQNQKHKQLCKQIQVQKEDTESSKCHRCGICEQFILESGNRFGLLTHCEHAFCLPCIKEYRSNKALDNTNVRSCPTCGVVSHFVVPHNLMVVLPQKKKDHRNIQRKNE
eukprot:TRINITY_DN2204_c0_g1_i2.p1 TRINITY_DN2204_c0_g1~~TRINITY_DN2204_c0_g1_i2.p1  ORF type:complete len:516 (-),score=77.60 TRINITY_DN2204_c0_g1_i2:161-1708(-)